MPDQYDFKVYKSTQCYKTNEIQSNYRQYVFDLDVQDFYVYTRDVRAFNARNLTIFVKNMGDTCIHVHIQNSPNGIDYADEAHILRVEAGEFKTLVPYIFSKYIRLAAKSESGVSRASIWIEVQEFDYYECSCTRKT